MDYKYKVVLTDADLDCDWKPETERLAAVGAQLVFLRSTDGNVIAQAAADADALMVGYAPIGADVIAAMGKCRSITKLGIGVNNIDVPAATARGIQVLNVPDYCVEEVSDTVVSLTLSLTRGTPFYWDNVQRGNWSREGCRSTMRLVGKTFVFLGFGRIARRAAEKLRPFGVKLAAYDPYISPEAAAACGAQLVSLDQALAMADILSLNTHLTAETENIINRDTLAKMKPTALLINVSRGPMVNEPDLCEAILSGRLAGAGLDVICDEKPGADNPLFKLPNVIVTPHAAFSSPEAEVELREKALDDLIAVLTGGEPARKVNHIP